MLGKKQYTLHVYIVLRDSLSGLDVYDTNGVFEYSDIVEPVLSVRTECLLSSTIVPWSFECTQVLSVEQFNRRIGFDCLHEMSHDP